MLSPCGLWPSMHWRRSFSTCGKTVIGTKRGQGRTGRRGRCDDAKQAKFRHGKLPDLQPLRPSIRIIPTFNADEMRPLSNRALRASCPARSIRWLRPSPLTWAASTPGYIIEDKGLYTFYESFPAQVPHLVAGQSAHARQDQSDGGHRLFLQLLFYEVGRLTYDGYKKETETTRLISLPRPLASASRRASNCRRTSARAKI